MSELPLHVPNETNRLRSLILGLPDDFGGTPPLKSCYDPQSRFHVNNNTFPLQKDIVEEMNVLLQVFHKYEVEVYRPENITGLNQVFARDIGFVIGDKFVVANVIEDRKEEVPAIKSIIANISPKQLIHLPKGAFVEGGDVIVHNEQVFVGVSNEEDCQKFQVARTNYNGFNFLKENFPHLEFYAFELKKSDHIPEENALHLDCCFQPIGENRAIISPDVFRNKNDVNELIKLFGDENVLLVNSEEMSNMYTNVFSISKNIIISDPRFIRLNEWLEKNGFTVEKVAYKEISKMGGLFRCSTLPLLRE